VQRPTMKRACAKSTTLSQARLLQRRSRTTCRRLVMPVTSCQPVVIWAAVNGDRAGDQLRSANGSSKKVPFQNRPLCGRRSGLQISGADRSDTRRSSTSAKVSVPTVRYGDAATFKKGARADGALTSKSSKFGQVPGPLAGLYEAHSSKCGGCRRLASH